MNIFQPETPRFFPESFETANNGGGVTVYHNNGNGTFTDVTEKIGFKLSGWTLDLGHGDADNDGFDDLYVACDFGTDRFFLNNGNGTFTDMTEKAIGFDTKKGMNVDWGDYDNDGLLDIYVTNITDDYMREGNFLWHNNGNLTFTDVARETGMHDTGWGWGGKFFDYDNDGWLDLYVVNGWVSAGKESYVPDIFTMVTKPGIDFADARNWPPMGNKSLSGYEKKRLFHNEHGPDSRTKPRVTAWIRPGTAAGSRWRISITTAGSICSSPMRTPSRTCIATPRRQPIIGYSLCSKERNRIAPALARRCA